MNKSKQSSIDGRGNLQIRGNAVIVGNNQIQIGTNPPVPIEDFKKGINIPVVETKKVSKMDFKPNIITSYRDSAFIEKRKTYSLLKRILQFFTPYTFWYCTYAEIAKRDNKEISLLRLEKRPLLFSSMLPLKERKLARESSNEFDFHLVRFIDLDTGYTFSSITTEIYQYMFYSWLKQQKLLKIYNESKNKT